VTSAKILIVDDTEVNRALLTDYVIALGHEPITGTNGREALSLLRDHSPDLLLLDLLMPEMNGHEVLQEMKQDETLRHIPVLVISALDDMDSIVKGIQLGADDHLVKPFNPVLLRARIGACLEKKRFHDREVQYQHDIENANRLIRIQNQELRESNALKDKFLDIANHDLRNPIALMLTSLFLLQKEAANASEQGRELLRTMKRAAERMLSIVNDFLDYRKIQSGRITLNCEDLDINAVLGELLTDSETLGKDRHITFRGEFGKVPLVTGDLARVQQIAGNYISNALRFAPDRSEIVIRTRRNDPRVHIEVQDKGPGVKEEERSQLFSEFPKITSVPAGPGNSNGIGLSIVRRLAEAQGGRAGAEFPQGGGSIFWFELPVVQAGKS